ncbi:MAG: flippase-like domain-containing protein [Methyloprofundus sp.]|nr:flippase-like domain-containing protein [Methyloprofundus sp.]
MSVLILGWLAKDLNLVKILENLKLLPLWAWFAALFTYLLAQILSSIRWQLIAQSLGLHGSFNQYLDLYFLGMFFNLFLPTGMGGDAVKSYHLGKRHSNHLNSAYSILFDRLTGLCALLIICAFALWHVALDETLNLIIIAATTLSVGGLIFAPSIFKLLQRVLPQLSRWISPLQQLYHSPMRLLLIFMMAIAIQLIGLSIVIGLGTLLAIKLSWSFYIVCWTLITLATLLPISINGLGVREAGFVYLFQTQGIDSEQAITLSLLTFLIPLLASLFGLLPFFSLDTPADKKTNDNT